VGIQAHEILQPLWVSRRKVCLGAPAVPQSPVWVSGARTCDEPLQVQEGDSYARACCGRDLAVHSGSLTRLQQGGVLGQVVRLLWGCARVVSATKHSHLMRYILHLHAQVVTLAGSKRAPFSSRVPGIPSSDAPRRPQTYNSKLHHIYNFNFLTRLPCSSVSVLPRWAPWGLQASAMTTPSLDARQHDPALPLTSAGAAETHDVTPH